MRLLHRIKRLFRKRPPTHGKNIGHLILADQYDVPGIVNEKQAKRVGLKIGENEATLIRGDIEATYKRGPDGYVLFKVYKRAI